MLGTAKLWEPDVLVEEEFITAHLRKNPLLPEKALMFAVLTEAIETYQKHAFSDSRRGRALFAEAERWFNDRSSRQFVFSFTHICEVIGLNPDYLCRGLRQWKAKGQPSMRNRRAKPSVSTASKRSYTWRSRRFPVSRCRSPRPKGGWL